MTEVAWQFSFIQPEVLTLLDKREELLGILAIRTNWMKFASDVGLIGSAGGSRYDEKVHSLFAELYPSLTGIPYDMMADIVKTVPPEGIPRHSGASFGIKETA